MIPRKSQNEYFRQVVQGKGNKKQEPTKDKGKEKSNTEKPTEGKAQKANKQKVDQAKGSENEKGAEGVKGKKGLAEEAVRSLLSTSLATVYPIGTCGGFLSLPADVFLSKEGPSDARHASSPFQKPSKPVASDEPTVPKGVPMAVQRVGGKVVVDLTLEESSPPPPSEEDEFTEVDMSAIVSILPFLFSPFCPHAPLTIALGSERGRCEKGWLC